VGQHPSTIFESAEGGYEDPCPIRKASPDTIVVIISCCRRERGRSGDINAPNVANAWYTASGMRLCDDRRRLAICDRVNRCRVLDGIQLPLHPVRPAQLSLASAGGMVSIQV
jgi:hypothetical protein